MNSPQPRQFVIDRRRLSPHGDAIEWEELPSLAASLNQRMTTRGGWRQLDGTLASDSGFDRPSAWDPTAPAPLDPLPPSQPMRETLRGLATREVHEPDIFDHFFGPGSR